MTTAYYLETKQ